MRDATYVRKLTDILVKIKAITPEMKDALEQQFAASSHERFDDFLLEQGLVDKEDLLKALSMLYQVPALDAVGSFFDTFLLKKFPIDFLLRNAIIPYEQDEDMLLVVAADPSDSELLEKIGEHVSYDIRFNVGIYTDIVDSVRQYYETALTELGDENQSVRHEDQEIRIQDLDDLPVAEDERDLSLFIKDKIDEFVKTEDEHEREQIEQRMQLPKDKKK